LPYTPDESIEIDPDAVAQDIIRTLEDWREEKRSPKGKVDANVFCAGLYVTQALSGTYPLASSDYLTASQVKGASGENAKAILAEHGETRTFLREGGRTSRKTRPMAIELAELLNNHGSADELGWASEEERATVAWALQAWFVRQIQAEYFAKERVKAEISHDKPVRIAVLALLQSAGSRGGNSAGAVAQHLVGAKLVLRFPGREINNESYTTADQQTVRPGDFQVGDTAIHVTMSPGQALFEGRCKSNIRHGFRPRVLVPENRLLAARQLAETADIGDKVAVQSIEDFVGTNIEEMAGFEDQAIKSGLRLLLETYNARVESVESDPGLLVEIPANL
jgi:hypothetical protein